MQDNNNLSRESWIGIILLLILILSLASSEAFLPLLFIALGGYMLWRQSQNREDGGVVTSNTYPPQYTQEEPFERYERQREPSAGRVYKHALGAVRNAGLDVDELQVLPVDIGIMAFEGAVTPVIHRTWDVADDVDYIQPFVELRLPTKAVGLVRFELIDSSGDTVYIHEERHELKRGRNLITPSTRLPIHDELTLTGDWELRVSADKTLLAVHHFGWVAAESSDIRTHIGEDGELSSELRAVMAESRLREMSLDELLADQDEEDQQQQAGR